MRKMIRDYWTHSALSFKAALLLVAFLSLSVGIAIGTKAATAATLKPVSIIEGDMLRVSDIFDGISGHSDRVIGAAPQPGQDMVLNARTLYRIAVAMNLPWRPSTMNEQVTVRREANLVSFDVLKNSLKNEIQNKGLNDEFNLVFYNEKPSIILPNDVEPNIEIASLNLDLQSDSFVALAVAPSKENPLRKINLSGKIERLVSVPVLRSALQNGDVIGENDLDWVQIPVRELQHNAMTKKDDMVGMTPRRIIYPGKFILKGTLEKPQLVERGENITITFQSGPMQLTAKGKALQSGAIGDTVRVTNNASSRTISARVSGDKQVIVH